MPFKRFVLVYTRAKILVAVKDGAFIVIADFGFVGFAYINGAIGY
jgi:hypothetical protein